MMQTHSAAKALVSLLSEGCRCVNIAVIRHYSDAVLHKYSNVKKKEDNESADPENKGYKQASKGKKSNLCKLPSADDVTKTKMQQRINTVSEIHKMFGSHATVTQISSFMRNRKSLGLDFLVIHEPGNLEVIRSFVDAGVKNIVCAVKDEVDAVKWKEMTEHHVPCSVYDYNMLTYEIERMNGIEQQIQQQFLPNAGCVILTEFSSQDHFWQFFYSRFYHDSVFYMAPTIDIFCVIPADLWKKLQLLDLRTKARTVFQVFNTCKQILNASQGFDQASLVHIAPKQELFLSMDMERRKNFVLFMEQMRSHGRVIPKLEQFVQGSGRYLILEGFTMAEELCQLKPDQFLQIFQIITCIPEFRGSVLRGIFESRKKEPILRGHDR